MSDVFKFKFDVVNKLVKGGWLAVLSESEKDVLLALWSHSDRDGGNAYPAAATLAKYAGISERAVFKALKRLESLKLVATTAHPQGSKQRTTTRAILTPPAVPFGVQRRKRAN